MRPIDAVREAVASRLRGKEEAIELALVALLAQGHLLIEDAPGVGKTTLAASLAASLGLSFARVQMTADLLPADLTGVHVLRDGGFSFIPGPLFSQVVLADELNRAPARTQSALLEAMEEGRITARGETRELPRPFWVIATLNPREFAGTYPLPESQLDRFSLRISLGYPDREAERAVLIGARAEALAQVASEAELREHWEEVGRVQVHRDIEDWILDLAARSRVDPAFSRGISPRAARSLYRAVRALAWLRGRSYAIPEDARALALPALSHRVSGAAGRSGAEVLTGLLGQIRFQR